MFAFDLWTDLACAGGQCVGSLSRWRDAQYGFALDGNAACSVAIPVDDRSLPKVLTQRVWRLLESRYGEVEVRGEYRIRRITPSLGGAFVHVEAAPIQQDLARVMIRERRGGIWTTKFADNLTREDWIDAYVMPSLALAGVDWIAKGTITAATERSLSFQGWSCLQLIRALEEDTDEHLDLTMDGDSGYDLNIIDVGASADRPQLIVGRNITALSWTKDGMPQATVIAPQGITPNGEEEPRDAGEYAAKVTATTSTTLTIEDPDTGDDPILITDQEKGQYLELLMPPIRLRDESRVALGGGNANLQTADTMKPREACYVSNGSRKEIAVAVVQETGTTGRLLFYNALTRAYVGIVTVGTTPWGCYYHSGQDRVYVVNSGAGTVSVVNPNTKAVVATITVQTGPRHIAFASSSGYLYVGNFTSGTVSVIDTATNTVVTNIASVAAADDVCYDPTNDRIVVGSGSNLKFINPGTNAVVDTLSIAGQAFGIAFATSTGKLYVCRRTENDVKVVDGSGTPAVSGTLTGFTTPEWAVYDPDAVRVLVTHNSTELGIINPAGPTFEASVYHTQATQWKPGPYISAHALWWMPVDQTAALAGQGWLFPWSVTTESLALRKAITAASLANQTVTVAATAPIAASDLVAFRDNVDGDQRGELAHPINALDPPTGYGRIVRPFRSDQWRGERNYALNPWAEDAGPDDLTMPYWERSKSTNADQPGMVAYGWDSSGWTAFAAVKDGTQAGPISSLTLKGMNVGDVLQPGDYFPDLAIWVTHRAVVDGAGKVTVALFPSYANTLTDGVAVNIRRPGFGPTDFPSGRAGVMFPSPSAPEEIGTLAVVPYWSGRTTLWCTVDLWIMPISGLDPKTMLSLRVQEGSNLVDTVIASKVFADDDASAAPYADYVPRRYIISYAYTMSQAARVLQLRAVLEGAVAASVYIRRFEAVLGTQGALDPPVRVNGGNGELYRASWRALRDLADPIVSYSVSAIDDHLTMTLGARTVLEHPSAGIFASPRVVAVDFAAPPPGLDRPVRRPTIQLENRERSLVRTLAMTGIGSV